MQTPAGFRLVERARAELTDFWAAVFNPSTLPRFIAHHRRGLITGAFFMAGIAAWYSCKGRDSDVARESLSSALVVGARRLAAQLRHRAPPRAAGGPDPAGEVRGHRGALHRRRRGAADPSSRCRPPSQAAGLEARVDDPRPPQLAGLRRLPGAGQGPERVPARGLAARRVTFVSFHNMVVLGTDLLIARARAACSCWRGKLGAARAGCAAASCSGRIPLPMIAIQLGWMAAEVGRQPWIVYGLHAHPGRGVARRSARRRDPRSRSSSSRSSTLAARRAVALPAGARGDHATAPAPARAREGEVRP